MRAWLGIIAVTVTACSVGGGADLDADVRSDGAMDSAMVACDRDIDCSDGIECTVDHCEDGECVPEPCVGCCPDDLECSTALGCTGVAQSCTEDSQCIDVVRCTLDFCRDGTVCDHAPQDGLCETGEVCLPALGCIPAPPDSCTTGDDCTRGNECLGEWSCQPEFGCQFRAPPRCDDGDDCTDDSCDFDMGMCVATIRDLDADGYGDESCGGDDCDDADPDVNPGAPELCDGDDDDCDGVIDEGCCTEGVACTTICGTAGMTSCAGGVESCVAAEICNGLDDDCDGAPDQTFECVEGRTRTCATSCAGAPGTETCIGCSWAGCVAPAEMCGGGDDDCDGRVDEGFACSPSDSGSCLTTCSTTGSRTCLGDCTWDSCIPPVEVCNGIDDDCDGAPDQTFECVEGRTRTCVTSCMGAPGTETCTGCSWAGCVAPAEMCGGGDDDCDGRVDEGFACSPSGSGSCLTTCSTTGSRTCLGDCTWDSCIPPVEICNGIDDDCNSVCDDTFSCCRGTSVTCATLGYVSGTALCRGDCSGYDESTCSNCGNSRIDIGESCDGSALGGNDCTTVPGTFGSGTLRCDGSCNFDTTSCSLCQNGTLDPGEQCDGSMLGGFTCATVPGGMFTDGTLLCSSACNFDTSMCTLFDPSGIYDVSPRAAYMCAFVPIFGIYLVDYDVMSFTFTDNGSTLRVVGARCEMTGPSARISRMISVTCEVVGGCTERYTLTGVFTSDTTWTGTFTSEFIPISAGDCADCTTQTHPMTGTLR